MLKELVQWELKSGTPQQINEWTITPQARVLMIHFPFGGFVWNWPVVVVVERNGRRTHHAINDPTRIILFALTGISTGLILGTIASRLTYRN